MLATLRRQQGTCALEPCGMWAWGGLDHALPMAKEVSFLP